VARHFVQERLVDPRAVLVVVLDVIPRGINSQNGSFTPVPDGFGERADDCNCDVECFGGVLGTVESGPIRFMSRDPCLKPKVPPNPQDRQKVGEMGLIDADGPAWNEVIVR